MTHKTLKDCKLFWEPEFIVFFYLPFQKINGDDFSWICHFDCPSAEAVSVVHVRIIGAGEVHSVASVAAKVDVGGGQLIRQVVEEVFSARNGGNYD